MITRSRPAPRSMVGIVGLVLLLVVAVTVVVAGGLHATASPTATSPGVYVVGGAGSTAAADQFSLAAILGDPGSIAPIQATSQPGGTFSAAAVTDDASSAVLLRQESSGDVVTVLRVASGAVAGTVAVSGSGPGEVAADPANPDQAYVADGSGLFRVGTGTGSGGVMVTPVITGLAFSVQAVAISPDGKTAYVGGLNGSTGTDVIDAVALSGSPNQVSWTQPAPAGDTTGVTDLALSPGGQEVFAADGAALLALDLPLSATAQPKIDTSIAGVETVTVSPDGTTVYAGGVNAASEAYIVGFPVASPATTTLRDLQGSAGSVSLAVSPDGADLLTAVGAAGSSTTSLYPISLTNDTPMPPGRAIALPAGLGLTGAPAALAITPDQSPVAALSAPGKPVDTATAFDASKSTVAYGTITSYRWSFGDGATATTTVPTTSHTYTKTGTFSASVVETDSAATTVPPAVPGTSFVVDGAGRTPYRYTTPGATATVSVVVAAPSAATTTVAPTTTVPFTGGELTLSPNVGPPGTIVAVTGSGFPANTPLTISWSVSTGSSMVITDANGNLATQLLILVPDVLGPRSAVVSGEPNVSASFLVVPGDAEPGGGDATPIFRSDSS